LLLSIIIPINLRWAIDRLLLLDRERICDNLPANHRRCDSPPTCFAKARGA